MARKNFSSQAYSAELSTIVHTSRLFRMILFTTFGIILAFTLQLYITHCRPTLSKNLISGSLQSSSLTLSFLDFSQWLNMTTVNGYPIKYRIGGTTITLSLQNKPKVPLIPSETIKLLGSVEAIAHKKGKNASVGDIFSYQDPLNHDAPLFGIVSALYLNEPTWGDVMNIAEGLMEYFTKSEAFKREFLHRIPNGHTFDEPRLYPNKRKSRL
jgi:hypothetical protein